MKLITALLVLLFQAGGLSSQALDNRLAPGKAAFAMQAPTLQVALPVEASTEPLNLGASAAYAVDSATMTPLFQSGASRELPIASLTKLVTVLVVLHDHAPGDEVTVPKLPTYAADDQILGLQTGQRFTIGDLVAAGVVASDDDAADALALADAGTCARFIVKMNDLAQQLNLTQTHFASDSGLTDTGNFSSARDLAIIAKVALLSPTIKSLIGQSAMTIHDTAGQSFTLNSTDNLLANGEFSGIKTGYTNAAGQCFVGLTTVSGHQIITVVLGSSDRFGDSLALKNWIVRNWQWQTPPM